MKPYVKTLCIAAAIMFLWCSLPAQNRIFDILFDGDYGTLQSVSGRVDNYSAKTDEGDSFVIISLKGFLARKRSSAGTTPLHIAASQGDYQSVDVLLKSGADPGLWDGDDMTPYALAMKYNHSRCAGLIQTYEQQHMDTSLEDSYGAVISFVISKGAPVNTYDKNGKSALMYAVESRSVKLASILVNSGADVSYTRRPNGQNALHLAVTSFQPAMVQILVKDRKAVNSLYHDGENSSVSKPVSDGGGQYYKKPSDYNLRVVVFSDRSDPRHDRRCFYKVYIDKVEAGRTVTGLESQKKVFTSLLEPNRHLIQVEKYILDKKKEKYVKLNNIYQPRPGFVYVELHPQRILELTIKHVTDEQSSYSAEFIKE